MNKGCSLSVRWSYLAIGVVAMLFAGVLYAWSILKAPLATEFGWKASALALNFTLAMSFFCRICHTAGGFHRLSAPLHRGSVSDRCLLWRLSHHHVRLHFLFLRHEVFPHQHGLYDLHRHGRFSHRHPIQQSPGSHRRLFRHLPHAADPDLCCLDFEYFYSQALILSP